LGLGLDLLMDGWRRLSKVAASSVRTKTVRGKARDLRFEAALLGLAGGGSFSVGSEDSAVVLLIQYRTRAKTKQVRWDKVK